MADQDKQSKDASSTRDASRANTEQSRAGRSAGSAENPQDGGDTGTASEARPRGKTEDPDITL